MQTQQCSAVRYRLLMHMLRVGSGGASSGMFQGMPSSADISNMRSVPLYRARTLHQMPEYIYAMPFLAPRNGKLWHGVQGHAQTTDAPHWPTNDHTHLFVNEKAAMLPPHAAPFH